MALDLSGILVSAWGHGSVCCVGYLSAHLSMWITASAREGCCTRAAEPLLAVEPLLNIPFLRIFFRYILHPQMGSEVPFQTILKI